MMGDNRYNSADSRYHMDDPGKGFVPLSDVVGKAFVVSWPVSHWSWLTTTPTSSAASSATRVARRCRQSRLSSRRDRAASSP